MSKLPRRQEPHVAKTGVVIQVVALVAVGACVQLKLRPILKIKLLTYADAVLSEFKGFVLHGACVLVSALVLLVAKVSQPTYRLEIKDVRGTSTTIWKGRASNRRLTDFMMTYWESLKPGGANHHLTVQLGYAPWPWLGQIIRQKDGVVKAEWVGDRSKL